MFWQAHFHKEAAQLLLQLAKSEADSHAPPLRLKKLYVLAALEVDQVKARMLNIGEQTGTGQSPSKGPPVPATGAAAHTLAGTSLSCAIGSSHPTVELGNSMFGFFVHTLVSLYTLRLRPTCVL